jgi:hypothetical protein
MRWRIPAALIPVPIARMAQASAWARGGPDHEPHTGSIVRGVLAPERSKAKALIPRNRSRIARDEENGFGPALDPRQSASQEELAAPGPTVIGIDRYKIQVPMEHLGAA